MTDFGETGDERIDWAKVGGLIPVVVQDHATRCVLMLGYMNREALRLTRASGKVTFFSRTRQCLWTKGESSGNGLTLESIALDCDGDTLLVAVRAEGPTCHLGTTTCFGEVAGGISFLAELDALIAARSRAMPPNSYTASLFAAGITRMAQKVGEEGVELALAAKDDDVEAMVGEAADLIFHTMVLLRARGLSLAAVARVLEDRHAGRFPSTVTAGEP